MANIVYSLLILAVAFGAIVSGFRKGLTRQIASLLGFGFGAVASRICAPEMADSFQWAMVFSPEEDFNAFTVSLVSGVTIYAVVFALFSILSPIFSAIFRKIERGMINRLAGTFFSLVKNLLWLSICMNLLLCFSPQSGLIRYERAGDGNLVAAVMAMTPAILGCCGAEDFAHFKQLKEAKYISCNYIVADNVIIKEDT